MNTNEVITVVTMTLFKHGTYLIIIIESITLYRIALEIIQSDPRTLSPAPEQSLTSTRQSQDTEHSRIPTFLIVFFSLITLLPHLLHAYRSISFVHHLRTLERHLASLSASTVSQYVYILLFGSLFMFLVHLPHGYQALRAWLAWPQKHKSVTKVQ